MAGNKIAMGSMGIHNIDVDIFKSSQKHLPVMDKKKTNITTFFYVIIVRMTTGRVWKKVRTQMQTSTGGKA